MYYYAKNITHFVSPYFHLLRHKKSRCCAVADFPQTLTTLKKAGLKAQPALAVCSSETTTLEFGRSEF